MDACLCARMHTRTHRHASIYPSAHPSHNCMHADRWAQAYTRAEHEHIALELANPVPYNITITLPTINCHARVLKTWDCKLARTLSLMICKHKGSSESETLDSWIVRRDPTCHLYKKTRPFKRQSAQKGFRRGVLLLHLKQVSTKPCLVLERALHGMLH